MLVGDRLGTGLPSLRARLRHRLDPLRDKLSGQGGQRYRSKRLSDVVADIGAVLLDGVGVNAGEVLDVVVQSSLDGQRGKGRIDLECRESVLRTELRGEVAEP